MVYVALAFVIFLVIALTQHVTESHRRVNAERKYVDADPQLRDDVRNKVIRVGMSEQQVVDSWGTPSRRTVRQLKTKVKVTLHYGTRKRVHLDNTYVVGWDVPTSV